KIFGNFVPNFREQMANDKNYKPKTKRKTSMKQMLLGTSPIRMKQKLSKATTASLFTSCFALFVHGDRRRQSLALLCWLVFAAGLLGQFFSPHIKVSNAAFVIPPGLAAGRNAIRPDEIVGGRRRMQLLS